jgi:hypothetical protein
MRMTHYVFWGLINDFIALVYCLWRFWFLFFFRLKNSPQGEDAYSCYTFAITSAVSTFFATGSSVILTKAINLS